MFQHRHYKKIAAIIATLPEENRAEVARRFELELRVTNPAFDGDRFYTAALGQPTNKRDR
jgi:hypothetical protein